MWRAPNQKAIQSEIKLTWNAIHKLNTHKKCFVAVAFLLLLLILILFTGY